MHLRRKLRRSTRSTRTLVLEVLEGRWVPTTVTSLNDAGPGSLRQAILDTPTAGTVDFEKELCGTIRLTSSGLVINKFLTIAGPGTDCITVSGDNRFTVFTIQAGWTVEISGLTITRGSIGISNAGALTLNNSTITGSSTSQSAGGVNNTNNLTVFNSVLSGNTSAGGAGGIGNSGTLTVIGSTFSGNASLSLGGGIRNSGIATVTGSTFNGNSASEGGGIGNSGTLTVTNSTFNGNRANGSYGGGIGRAGGTMRVIGSTFVGNSTGGLGGGIGTSGGTGNITIDVSTFNLNAANDGAGIAHTNNGTMSLTNSTLSDNRASNRAGGIFRTGGGSLSIGNTIVAGNRAFAPSVDVMGVLNSQGYNLIGDGTGGSGYVETDLVGEAGMPIDPSLAPLDDYGGPTRTMPPLPGSPAVNTGDLKKLGEPDQRGVVRTGGVNIGSFQASATFFAVTAPEAVQAGTPFDVTVTALDPFGQWAIGYTGTVTFSSADPYGATLPANYTFAAADAGTHEFPGGASLYTTGTWDVTAIDPDNGITGSALVAVTPAPAVGFVIIAPASVGSGVAFDVTLVAVDPYGNTDTNYQGTITWMTTDADPNVVLPANYTFLASDQGVHNFMGEVTLLTLGDQLLTATDTSSGITGSATVSVSSSGPGANPGHRRHTQPPTSVGVDRLFEAAALERRDAWVWVGAIAVIHAFSGANGPFCSVSPLNSLFAAALFA